MVQSRFFCQNLKQLEEIFFFFQLEEILVKMSDFYPLSKTS